MHKNKIRIRIKKIKKPQKEDANCQKKPSRDSEPYASQQNTLENSRNAFSLPFPHLSSIISLITIR